jgi:hypothetical protein
MDPADIGGRRAEVSGEGRFHDVSHPKIPNAPRKEKLAGYLIGGVEGDWVAAAQAGRLQGQVEEGIAPRVDLTEAEAPAG